MIGRKVAAGRQVSCITDPPDKTKTVPQQRIAVAPLDVLVLLPSPCEQPGFA